MKKMPNNYCIWRANCVILDSRKWPREDLSTYLCCHDCYDTKCDVRCTTDLTTCTYKCDQETAQGYIDRATKRLNNGFEAIKPEAKVNLSKEHTKTVATPEKTPEQPLATTSFQVPQNKKALAALLKVSYDKVAYRIDVKKMTYQQVYEELKNAKR